MTTDTAKPLLENYLPLATVEVDNEIPEDTTFSYAGFQVVRGEFFSHIYEPSITFNDYSSQSSLVFSFKWKMLRIL